MTRDEALALLASFLSARDMYTGGMDIGADEQSRRRLRAIALHGKVIDAMCGEESTDPLAGNAP